MQIENFVQQVSVDEYLANYVDMEKTMGACRKCPVFGKSWSCPPFEFDVMKFWHQFSTMELYCRKFTFEDEDFEEGLDVHKFFYNVRDEIEQELYEREKEEPGSTSFVGGTCDICGLGKCARREGEPCRFPKYMRHTIEALGGDVEKTLKDFFDIEVVWPKDGRIPFMVFVTALLRPAMTGVNTGTSAKEPAKNGLYL